jgi:hypothetical protein
MPGLLRKPRRALVPGTCPELDDRHAKTRNKITIAANAYSAIWPLRRWVKWLAGCVQRNQP